MIKTLQRKFLMVSTCLISIVLLLLIFTVNYAHILKFDHASSNLAQDLAVIESRSYRAETTPQILPTADEAVRDSAVYFTLFLDGNGKIIKVNNDRSAGLAKEECIEIFNRQVIDRQYEIVDSYKTYTLVDSTGYQTKVFLDISRDLLHFETTLIISLITGCVILFLIVLFLYLVSKHYAKPYILNLSRQKQFITDAGHELKTPLSIIRANTDALELYQGESKWTKNIKSQTDRLTALTENLLTLSKIDEEAIKLIRKDIDLNNLITMILDSHQEMIHAKGLDIKLNLNKVGKIVANPDLIYQLFSTVIENAVKYTNQDGVIRISLTKQRNICFEISNTCDTSNIELDKIFDRFYRADVSRNQSDIKGFGIGLSAAKGICQGYDYDITARIDKPGLITFTINM